MAAATLYPVRRRKIVDTYIYTSIHIRTHVYGQVFLVILTMNLSSEGGKYLSLPHNLAIGTVHVDLRTFTLPE